MEEQIMSKEQPQFNVLLDKIEGSESRGLRLGGGELSASRFYRRGNTGVADSVQAVQDAGLLQVPSYAYIKGRSFVGLDAPVWSNFQDSLGERLTLNANKTYEGVPRGDWVVDVQGGGLFMPRHEIIKSAVEGNALVNGAIRIPQEDKDLLLGERQVYRWDGEKLETVPVDYFFTSFAEFDDVSGIPEFQKALTDLNAVYVVLRPASEARENPSEYRSIGKQLQNSDLIIPSGGRARLSRILMEASDEEGKQVPRFGWTQFGSWHDGYKNQDTGHGGVLGYYVYGNVDYGSDLNDDGGSGGVAPEALEQLRARAPDNQSLEKKV
jgi:hypothetical protein